ncbi:phospholipase A2 inhibitor NAI-like isoform X1 [Ranitomeya variabilis]|uniref:phospholipase A2 inhibitor NAI-like isoform X1 n=1 Tax=Ranitomeya variabilis TaxID=490064 RepID=UPI00405655A9
MASVWTLLCLISALGRTGSALRCTQCMALGLSSCTEGPTVTCHLGHVCTSLYQQTTMDGKTGEFLYRSCGPTSHCDKMGSFTTENKSIRMGVSCCLTDNCSPPLPPLPPISTRRNGRVCQLCSDTNEACTGTKTIDCVGSESKCLLQVTRIKESPDNVESFRGCSTRSICEIGNQNMSIGILSMESTYHCSGGAITVYGGLDISVILALVLMLLQV